MEQTHGVDPTQNNVDDQKAKTEQGAVVGKPAPDPSEGDGDVDYKTSANTALAEVKSKTKEFIEDLENIPASIKNELHSLFDAFHNHAVKTISEAPAV